MFLLIRAIAYSTEIIIYERTKIASTWGAWEIQGSASNVKVTPTGGIVATNVQAALEEIDGEVSELELKVGKYVEEGTAIIGNTFELSIHGNFTENQEVSVLFCQRY